MTKLLIVIDAYGWAWSHMADGIAKYAPKGVDITIVSSEELSRRGGRDRWISQFHGVCQCSWAEASHGIAYGGKMTTWVASHGFEYRHPVDPNGGIPARIATRNRNSRTWLSAMRYFDAFLCVSDRIMDVLSVSLRPKIRVVPGVDVEIFPKQDWVSGQKLRVGWCGQESGVTKGHKEILSPLRRRLGGEVEWIVNSRDQSNALSRGDMVRWYEGIDVLISTSCSEGFQMPIIEAMSCGRPVIATDCGAANEVVSDGQSGFILHGYTDAGNTKKTIEEAEFAIREYMDRPDKMREHGDASREIVESRFNWETRSKEWVEAML